MLSAVGCWGWLVGGGGAGPDDALPCGAAVCDDAACRPAGKVRVMLLPHHPILSCPALTDVSLA